MPGPSTWRSIALLYRSALRHNVEVHAYCLMGNHYHLLLRTPKANLAEAMQVVLAQYTRNFNRRHGFDGALFRGRYRSVLACDDRALLAMSRYIHRNPVVAGMVSDPGAHAASSYRAYLRPKGREASWLTTSLTLALAGGVDAYRHLVQGPAAALGALSTYDPSGLAGDTLEVGGPTAGLRRAS